MFSQNRESRGLRRNELNSIFIFYSLESQVCLHLLLVDLISSVRSIICLCCSSYIFSCLNSCSVRLAADHFLKEDSIL